MRSQPLFSVVDLMPICGPIPKDHLIVILKSYFDGGNQADSKEYDVVTLASVSGRKDEWKAFEMDWKAALKKHGAPWLHTTDAVSLKREPFTKDNGWDKTRRDKFISDCVTVIEQHTARPRTKQDPDGKVGLVPYTFTIVLKDFIRARAANPEVPKTATEICATSTVLRCLEWGGHIGAKFYHLIFDQGEPFMSHILDRQNNKKARKHLAPITSRITSIGQSDMRDVPALQMADLFAWCISHKNQKPRHNWQNRLLSQHARWVDDWFTYDQLINIIPGVSDLVKSWKLPGRTPTR
jgi:hypothetical protein